MRQLQSLPADGAIAEENKKKIEKLLIEIFYS